MRNMLRGGSLIMCKGVDCSQTPGAKRVAAFVQAFKHVNRLRLQALTQACRTALKDIPSHTCGAHGRHFLETCFMDTAFAYGLIQVRKASDRDVAEHFDGGASLMHGGLTIWGKRTVEHHSTMVQGAIPPTCGDSSRLKWQGVLQEPGAFLYWQLLCGEYTRLARDGRAASV